MNAKQVSSPMRYGAFLGSLKRAMELFLQEIHEGFKLGYNPPKLSPLEIAEKRSQRKLALHIQQERRRGLQEIRLHAAQVRKELGLDDR